MGVSCVLVRRHAAAYSGALRSRWSHANSHQCQVCHQRN